ncbi:MAG: GNAT family N-acetyltransferase [Coriobacteriia bacterium]|nr:GNAT family N-acetyltransferase [Coriobacteriia bacterium]
MTTLEIRPLAASDDTDGFCSGEEGLDRYLRRHALENQEDLFLGVTYVLARVGCERIIGFVTVTASSVEPGTLPSVVSGKPRYALPVLRLARLGVDEREQRKGYGRALVQYVFAIALAQSARVGCVGVVVDAKPEAVGFYAHLRFEVMNALAGDAGSRPLPVPMYISIARVRSVHRATP